MQLSDTAVLLFMNEIDQSFLLELARKSISYYLEFKNYPEIDSDDLPSRKLFNKQGTFVTLTIKGKLRGCIGRIEPIKPVYEDIIENAISAAYFDPRFKPLKKQEISDIKIEISLLSIPKRLEYKTPEGLIRVLGKEKPGVIIREGANNATFLPQVWEDLKDSQDFLSQLCLKAGLPKDEWKTCQLDIFTYKAEVFHE